MKAAVYRSYGPPEVVQIEELEKPIPKDDEVLVRVHASSVNPVEWYSTSGLFLARLGAGLMQPKDHRLGGDFAGVVEAAGREAAQFKPGDAVYGSRHGAWAEYVCARAIIVPKPANLSFEQAGGVAVAAITALQGLRDSGRLQVGQRVLINGASGGVGTFAVQIARALGVEVTGVCSPANVEMIRSLGAQTVVDYTREDFTRRSERYDLLLDIAGSRRWSEGRRVLKPGGRWVIVGGPKSNRWIGPLGHIVRTRLAALGSGQQAVFFIANYQRVGFPAVERDVRGRPGPAGGGPGLPAERGGCGAALSRRRPRQWEDHPGDALIRR